MRKSFIGSSLAIFAMLAVYSHSAFAHIEWTDEDFKQVKFFYTQVDKIAQKGTYYKGDLNRKVCNFPGAYKNNDVVAKVRELCIDNVEILDKSVSLSQCGNSCGTKGINYMNRIAFLLKGVIDFRNQAQEYLITLAQRGEVGSGCANTLFSSGTTAFAERVHSSADRNPNKIQHYLRLFKKDKLSVINLEAYNRECVTLTQPTV